MSIHFLIKSFLKNGPLSLESYDIDKKNQALNLLLVTAAVEALYLDLWARKCFSFIFIVISNTISVTGFIKTTDQRHTDYRLTDHLPLTHRPTHPPTTYPPIYVKTEDQILKCFAFCNSWKL